MGCLWGSSPIKKGLPTIFMNNFQNIFFEMSLNFNPCSVYIITSCRLNFKSLGAIFFVIFIPLCVLYLSIYELLILWTRVIITIFVALQLSNLLKFNILLTHNLAHNFNNYCFAIIFSLFGHNLNDINEIKMLSVMVINWKYGLTHNITWCKHTLWKEIWIKYS